MISEYKIQRKYWSTLVEFSDISLKEIIQFLGNAYTYIGYDYYGFMFKKPNTYEMLFVPYNMYLIKDEFGNVWSQKDVKNFEDEQTKNSIKNNLWI